MSQNMHVPAGSPDPANPADSAVGAQRVFRGVLEALSYPGRTVAIPPLAGAPAALGGGLAAVALTLLDEDTPVWAHPTLANDAEAMACLAFHAGVRPVADSMDAAFVIATPDTIPSWRDLRLGTDEAPHESATILLDARQPGAGGRFTATGPGIDGSITIDAPWAPADFVTTWRHNGELFPRGVDLVAVTDESIVALPRTSAVVPAATEEVA